VWVGWVGGAKLQCSTHGVSKGEIKPRVCYHRTGGPHAYSTASPLGVEGRGKEAQGEQQMLQTWSEKDLLFHKGGAPCHSAASHASSTTISHQLLG
jgi:hypothetical protein